MTRVNRFLIFPGIGLILVLTACGGGRSPASAAGAVPIARSANSVAATVATTTVTAGTQ